MSLFDGIHVKVTTTYCHLQAFNGELCSVLLSDTVKKRCWENVPWERRSDSEEHLVKKLWTRPVLIPIGGVAGSQGASNYRMTEGGHLVTSKFGGARISDDVLPYRGTAVGPAS